MAKKNEKETKQNSHGAKEVKASHKDNRDKSERDLIREARRVKMSEIDSLPNHERKSLEKRTDKRYARMLRRMNTLFPVMVLIYGLLGILAFVYYKPYIMFGIEIPLFVISSYYISSRKGFKISVILGPIIYTVELVAMTVIAYVWKYALTVGLPSAISAIPAIISEISVDTSASYIIYNFIFVVVATVYGLLVRIFDNPRKYILKHEYVKMKNGD